MNDLNYNQLQEAIEEFNKNGLSGQDIKKAWRKQWEDGFDAAIIFIINYIKDGGFFENDEIANQFADEIIEEVDLYKKDG